MDRRTELPLDEMPNGDFHDFVKKYLVGSKTLDDKALKEIERVFGVGDDRFGYLNCDEAHAHGPECASYTLRTTTVVARLV